MILALKLILRTLSLHAHALRSVRRLVRVVMLAACTFHAALGSAADPLPVGAPRPTPLGTGELAPDFTLSDQDGRSHTLFAERGRRAVVLVFYRGFW